MNQSASRRRGPTLLMARGQSKRRTAAPACSASSRSRGVDTWAVREPLAIARRPRGVRLILAVALALTACGGFAAASPTPAPSPLPAAELKYRVMDAAGRIWFCDPDFYPLARNDEYLLAKQKLPEIQRDAPTYAAITARVGTDELAVYRDWKALNALALQPVNDVFGFAYLAQKTDKTGERVDGRVTAVGRVTVLSRTASGAPNCPICLALGTRIATPSGDVAVQDLRLGDVVWTIDAAGARLAAPLSAIGSTPVPPTHEVVRVVLDDGRVVVASPGHPTTDGRQVGDLHVGDALDGGRIVSAEREPYSAGFTFDVRPAGVSGAYWANGVLLGSTLP